MNGEEEAARSRLLLRQTHPRIDPGIGEVGEQVAEHLVERRLVNVLAVQHVQAGTDGITAKVQVVTARRLADQADFRDVRTGTAVRAAGDAQGERGAGEPVRLEQRLDAAEQLRQVALVACLSVSL